MSLSVDLYGTAYGNFATEVLAQVRRGFTRPRDQSGISTAEPRTRSAARSARAWSAALSG